MKTVFLDLDGTLTDSAEGITSSINHSLMKLGYSTLDPTDMGWMIGPPLIDTFTQLGVATPLEAVEHFRRQYLTRGLYQNSLYPGILSAINELKAKQFSLVLMTSKPRETAQRITVHFGIAPYLLAVYGPKSDDTRCSKGDLLGQALSELKADRMQSVMIGDRHYDFVAASMNGVASIGVDWGYGTDDELSLASARCAKVADLPISVQNLIP